MPYPNEHAIRLHNPGLYSRWRRKNDQGGPGIHFIFGYHDKPRRSHIQAVRFDASRYTLAQARAWVTKHLGQKILKAEKATGGSAMAKRRKQKPVLKEQALREDGKLRSGYRKGSDGKYYYKRKTTAKKATAKKATAKKATAKKTTKAKAKVRKPVLAEEAVKKGFKKKNGEFVCGPTKALKKGYFLSKKDGKIYRKRKKAKK